jgi:hypothetical protein
MSENNGESRMDRIREALADAQMCIEQSQRALLRSLKYKQADKEIDRLAESRRAAEEAYHALAKSEQCIDEILRLRKQ